MSAIKLSTPSSGSISLSPENTASNLTITVPAVTGTMATLTTPSFVSTIGVGGATPAASGAGITFPATQSASSDANTLDDYEEGTFTPTLTYVTPGTVSVGYATRVGLYTKVGNLVTINIALVLNAFTKGTASGNLRVTGLPFTSQNTTGNLAQGSIATSGAPTSTTAGNFPIVQIAANASNCVIGYSVNNASPTTVDPDANSEYYITVTYMV